jgi:hypothetical protein
MAVEGMGLLLLGVIYFVAVWGPAPSASLVALSFMNAIPWWLAGWLVFNLVFLVGLRPRKRFVSIRWCVLSSMRLAPVVGTCFDTYAEQLAQKLPFQSYSVVFASAALLAVVSSLIYSAQHDAARNKHAIPNVVISRPSALALLAGGELAFLAAVVLTGEGFDQDAWLEVALICGLLWLPSWIGLMVWEAGRRRRNLPVTRRRFLIASFARAWIGVWIYSTAWFGLSWYQEGLISFNEAFAFPVVYSVVWAGGFVALPALAYCRLTGLEKLSSAEQGRLQGGLSLKAAIAAAGAELILIVLSLYVFVEDLVNPYEDGIAGARLQVLVLLAPLAWLLLRWPVLLRYRGWKAIGQTRFLLGSTIVSCLTALAFHFTIGPSVLHLDWLAATTGFGLISGWAYILDCKLRADDLLPS